MPVPQQLSQIAILRIRHPDSWKPIFQQQLPHKSSIFAVGLVLLGPGWRANMVGAWATQRAESIAAMAKRGFLNADPTNLNSLGGPMQSPTNVISNPGKAVEAPNAETSLVKNSDGSVVGRMAGTSVVFNLPSVQ